MPNRPLLLALLLGSALAPAAHALEPGDYERTLVFDGVERGYTLSVPPGYDGSTPIALVLDLHGLGSNKEQQKGISGIAGLADSEGFAAVWPDGTDNSWNAGFCCGGAVANQVDDVGFIRTLVGAVRNEVAIDGRRIYVTGLSNGGAMTQVLACRAADLFAAAAPMAFPIPYIDITSCAPSRPIPVLGFQGLTDVLVPYEGSDLFASAAESFAQWRTNDACGKGDPEQHDVAGASHCDIDSSCADGTQVGLCSILCTLTMPASIAGHVLYVNDDYDLASLAWTFFSQFALPGAGAPHVVPLAGKKLALKDDVDAAKAKLDLALKDAAFVLPPTLDPTANGATLQVANAAGSGESACLVLPAASWKRSGKSFVYKDKKGASGPCQSAKLAQGKLEAKCSGKQQPLGYTLDEAQQGSVALRFASGADGACAVFGGTITRDTSTAAGAAAFEAKSAPAPAACPETAVPCEVPK